METTAINSRVLADRLDALAKYFDDEFRRSVRAAPTLTPPLSWAADARQCREWAGALRGVRMIGFGKADTIELSHD